MDLAVPVLSTALIVVEPFHILQIAHSVLFLVAEEVQVVQGDPEDQVVPVLSSFAVVLGLQTSNTAESTVAVSEPHFSKRDSLHFDSVLLHFVSNRFDPKRGSAV